MMAALGMFMVGCVGCQDGSGNEPSTECGGGEIARLG